MWVKTFQSSLEETNHVFCVVEVSDKKVINSELWPSSRFLVESWVACGWVLLGRPLSRHLFREVYHTVASTLSARREGRYPAPVDRDYLLWAFGSANFMVRLAAQKK